MQIKRYEANSIQDALTRIRADMGEDAVILSTKRLSGGRQPLFEIAAARDDRDNVAPPGRGTSGKVERKGDQPEGGRKACRPYRGADGPRQGGQGGGRRQAGTDGLKEYRQHPF